MLCFVSSCVHESFAVAATIRAKMLAIGELQGPFSESLSRKVAYKHHIVSMSQIFLIGVIDLAGLFVP